MLMALATYKLLHIRVFFRALTIAAAAASSSSSSYRNRLHRSGHICWDMDLGAGDSEMGSSYSCMGCILLRNGLYLWSVLFWNMNLKN
jgi:hypothetical protein